MQFKIKYRASGRISSIASLASTLSVTEEELLGLSKDIPSCYKKKNLAKKSGGYRTVYVPDKQLKGIQKKINSRIFGLIKFPEYLQGSISDPENQRCYIRCAAKHCEAVAVSHVDIKDFFDGIDYSRVYSVFSDLLNFSDEVSDLLSTLCTLRNYVPQGAPTSSYIANLVFHEDEPGIVMAAERMGATYTRLVDDITLSVREKNVSLDKLTRKIRKMITDLGLEVNDVKSRIETRGRVPLTVHGIRVVEKNPRITRDEVRKIRSAVHKVVMASKVANYRTRYDYYKLYHSTSGRLSKLKRVNHPAYISLRNKLKPILPLPSKIFKKKLEEKVEKLERNFDENHDKAWYRKEWNLVYYRLGILGRTYKSESMLLRNRINQVSPAN